MIRSQESGPTTPAAKIRAPRKELVPSFAKALFHGHIVAERLFPYPVGKRDEQDLLNMTLDSISKLAREINVEEIEEKKRLPDEVLNRLKEMGLFGLIVPEEYGGFGFSNASYVQVLAALSLIDASITATLGAHQSIGMKALLLYGSEEQKKAFLPKLATGEMIAAFALTEPGAGSDAGSLKTKAELSSDGSHYILNGNKIWITNGGIADFFTVFAKTKHRDAEGKEKEKITTFIVTREMAGFSTGPEEKKLGLWGSSTTAITFENVKVPTTNVIGQPGQGFKIAMGVLNNGRLGLASACALGSKKLIQMAMDHALTRQQFGKPLAHFGLIQSKFANMVVDTYVAESMVRITAELMDEGKFDYSVESAICKIFSTEAEWKTVNECLQIAGGTGYMREYGYEKVLRDSRIFMIWEGANEILRLFVGLSGIQGPAEQLKEISETLKKPLSEVIHSFGILSDFGLRWLQKRTFGSAIRGAHAAFEKESKLLEKYTGKFSAAVEVALLKHGKKIVENEFVVRRIADMAIDLYAMSCCLSRASHVVTQKSADRAQQDIDIVRMFFRRARRRLSENLRRMGKNEDSLEERIAMRLYESGGYSTARGFVFE